MTKREQVGVGIGLALAVAITGYSAWKLMGTGVLSWHVIQPEFAIMMGTLLITFLLFFSLFFYGKGFRVLLLGGLGILGVFSWIHVIFFPVLLGGIYVLYLIGVGRFLSRRFGKNHLWITWSFMLGSGATIAVFCLLSLAGIGGINQLRIWVAVTGVLLLLGEPGFGKKPEMQPLSVTTSLMLAAIITLVFLQVGRMNIAVDFDSIWYGTRSAFMLNSGTSIYENLGTLGVVYTYPKGWEVLTLPLAGLPSYSFSIACNSWVMVLTLVAAWETACVSMKPKQGLWVPFFMAALPGIMNMGGTAKADMMTLMLQILMVQAMLRYEKERQLEVLIMGLGAGALSLAMKPTAVVFSTAIVGVGLIWVLWDRWNQRKRRNLLEAPPISRVSWMFLVLPVTALIGIWGRTLRLVGVPVTSVFYQIFQTIGFQVKYPFYASGFPAAGGEMTWGEKAGFLGRRLYGVLLNPQGEDMSHVIIAWGTVLPLIIVVIWALVGLVQQKRTSTKKWNPPSFFTLLIPVILAINLISLYSLSQIDGNYYMLLYALLILAGCIHMETYSSTLRAWTRMAWMPAWILGVMMCGLTNWAWALGMGEISLVNPGYFNHKEMEQEKRKAQGSGAIWELLSQDPKNRVIALGEHPGVLTFPCNVQSYVDVSGYWGNPDVVGDAGSFLRYLQYAKIDYLYMEKEYIDTSVRIYQIIRTLVEQGWLWDVRDENGNLILAVAKEKPDLRNILENLELFDTQYIQHP